MPKLSKSHQRAVPLKVQAKCHFKVVGYGIPHNANHGKLALVAVEALRRDTAVRDIRNNRH